MAAGDKFLYKNEELTFCVDIKTDQCFAINKYSQVVLRGQYSQQFYPLASLTKVFPDINIDEINKYTK